MTGLVEKPKTLWLCEEKRKNQHRWDNGEVSRRAEGFFGSLQDFIYPPTSDYFWYRTGKLNREDMPKKWKRLIVVCLILGIAANGILAGAIASTALHLLDAFSNGTDIEGETLQVYAKSILESVFSPFGLILCGSISGGMLKRELLCRKFLNNFLQLQCSSFIPLERIIFTKLSTLVLMETNHGR